MMMSRLTRWGAAATVAVCLASAGVGATAQAQTRATPVAATTESAGTVASAAASKKVAIPTEITIQREVFDYTGNGRRDPYKSLMSTSDVRPLLSDLRLTVVVFDPSGSNSVAILRDGFSKQQYRVRVGQQLGRLRVSSIKQKTVQFTVEEFGFNRIETLPLSSDTSKVRNP
jgi:hypothetical protein